MISVRLQGLAVTAVLVLSFCLAAGFVPMPHMVIQEKRDFVTGRADGVCGMRSASAEGANLDGSQLFVGSPVKQRIEAIGRQVPPACLTDELAGAGEEGLLLHLDRGSGSPMDAQRAEAVLLQNPVREEVTKGGEHFMPGYVAGAGQFGRTRERIAGFQVALNEGDDHRADQLSGPVAAAVTHGCE